ncbi:MAG: LysM peptidoglycan-binding domain-containing protein [Lachnospiraceae bacterium]|jgi:spore germination protein|nr:LysM peptidoglycan-binding domain-containing protein [Lachnospiraceae bacterium]
MQIHVVAQGDTISSIARNYGVSERMITEDNQLIPPYSLVVGQALYIATQQSTPSESISVGGYAYPFISDWVLDQTLPFLSDLLIFSYGFMQDGTLIAPTIDPQKMIQKALAQNVKPILTLTPLDEKGNFNNLLIKELVNQEDSIVRLLTQLQEEMVSKGYQGVNIDFEFILAEDKDAFTAFVQRVASTMRPLGYETSVALAPKTSADQQGAVYVGKDYPALGAAADSVLLMTYEWGYTYDRYCHRGSVAAGILG